MTPGQLAQGSGVLGRQGEDQPLIRRRLGLGGLFIHRGLLEYQVHVGAPEAEGTDPGQQRRRGRRPIDGDGGNRETHRGEWDVRVGLLEVQAGRNPAVLQTQRDLDQARHARSGLEVAQVGLHRPDETRGRWLAALRDHRRQRPHLYGLTKQGARPMRLDVADLVRIDPGVTIGAPKHSLLCLGAGRHQAVTGSVLVDRAPADHRVNTVPVGLGCTQRFQHHHAGTLGADITIGAGVEGLAPAVGGHGTGPRETDTQVGREDEVDAAGYRR